MTLEDDGWVVVLKRDCVSWKMGYTPVRVMGELGKAMRTGVVCVVWDEESAGEGDE